MLVAKPRNRKWRLISRPCCPPPAAALRAAWGACGAPGRAARACFWGATSTEKLPKQAFWDYPSRPSSPADRWLYLLIGPLNLLGWRAPRAASGAPEAHRHTTPASALKQAPHWEPQHTHMRRRREDRTLPVHTYNQRTLACKGRGGWVTRDCARLGRWG